MARDLTFSELDAEHVELLPARTLMTALLIPAQTTGVGASIGALSSVGVHSSDSPQCDDVPWWAPKPPDC